MKRLLIRLTPAFLLFVISIGTLTLKGHVSNTFYTILVLAQPVMLVVLLACWAFFRWQDSRPPKWVRDQMNKYPVDVKVIDGKLYINGKG